MEAWSEVRKTGRGIPPGRGPYDVGSGDVMTNNVEPGILLRLFYPIDKANHVSPMEERPSWLPSNHYAQGYAYIGGVSCLGSRLHSLLGNIRIPSQWHGELSESKNRYPVVIFSHGLGGCRTTYTSTCLDIASCGCVVAAVEHRENSACHSFFIKNHGNDNANNQTTSQQNYQSVNFIKAPYEVPELRLKQLMQRREECITALTFLDALNDGIEMENDLDKEFDLSQFKDRLDVSSAAICGHSFGGATTVATLSQDSRFKCGVACDPWGYPLSLHESFRTAMQPMLFIDTEKFMNRDHLSHLLGLMPDPMATTGTRRMITIRGTDHQCQTDLGLVFHGFLAKLLKMRDKLDPVVAIQTNNDALIDFLSNYIDLERGSKMAEFNPTTNPLIMIGHNVNLTPPTRWWQRGGTKDRKGGKICPTDANL